MRDLEKEIESLRETNRRLNRRCQKAESQARKYKRRFHTIQNPIALAQERVEIYSRRLKDLYRGEFRNTYRGCILCRNKYSWKMRLRKFCETW